jgi:hypothetical protein
VALPRGFPVTSVELTPVRLGAIAVLISIAYSCVRLACDPLINPDAVYYLVAAERWMTDGLEAALKVYWRPFYSILIGSVASITGLTPLASAYVVDALLEASLLIAVQLLVRSLGGGLVHQALAMLLVLLWPSLNELRVQVMRDFGYWSASVLALAALARFAGRERLVDAGWFHLAVLVAMLFRPEAVVLLVLPLALLVRRREHRLRLVVRAWVPLLLAGALLGGGAVVSDRIATFVGGLVQESIAVPLGMLDSVPERLSDMRDTFARQVLDVDFHDFAGLGLAFGVVGVVTGHLLAAISAAICLIILLGLRREVFARMEPDALHIALAMLVTLFLTLCVFLVIRPIMQTRFLILPALVVLAFAPFAVEHIRDWTRAAGENRAFRWGAIVVFAYLIGEAGFSLTQSKTYLLDGVDLIVQQTEPDARVLSNDPRVTYLSGRGYEWRDLQAARGLERLPRKRQARLRRDYDYWALQMKPGTRQRARLETLTHGWREIGRTENRKGDLLVVLATPSANGTAPSPDR